MKMILLEINFAQATNASIPLNYEGIKTVFCAFIFILKNCSRDYVRFFQYAICWVFPILEKRKRTLPYDWCFYRNKKKKSIYLFVDATKWHSSLRRLATFENVL